MPRRTASQASSSKIAAADRASRKPKRLIHRTDAEGGEALLALPRPVRTVQLPEPVDVSSINGRDPQAWEEGEIEAARKRERGSELAMFDGLIG